MITRKRKRMKENIPLNMSNDIVPIQGSGYKIIDSIQLSSLIAATCCSKCKNYTLEMRQNNKKRKGMCETMLLYCTHCDEVIKTIDISKKVESENA